MSAALSDGASGSGCSSSSGRCSATSTLPSASAVTPRSSQPCAPRNASVGSPSASAAAFGVSVWNVKSKRPRMRGSYPGMVPVLRASRSTDSSAPYAGRSSSATHASAFDS